MERADSAYLPLMELEEKAGQAIADMVDVPAAYITAGAGSALTLATAALMAGDDDDKIQQLPGHLGMKNEILIQRRQRYWYDRCLELAGAKLVEYGSDERTTRADLEAAIGPNTAAVHYYAVEQVIDPDALPLEDTIEIAHAHGLPVTVDAAGQIYPLDLFGKYIRMGADFQCVAAKYLGATQSVGLALGTEEMIHKLSLQSFVGYEGRRIRGVGRPQKVDRRDGGRGCGGAALDDDEPRGASGVPSRRGARPCWGILRGTEDKGLKSVMLDNVIGHQPFGLELNVDESVAGMSAQEVVDKLKDGDPPIWTRVREGEENIVIHMFGLAEGEEVIVGERIRELFI